MVNYVIFGLQLFAVLIACFIGYIGVISKREEVQSQCKLEQRKNHGSREQSRTTDSM
ncbi:hypothetical protein [Salinisphaera sp. C84B14]|uniref:hypothetical protein n=1 Tax=Salinisphaera sp. C84B14 TaxID=1304155 RepID=UPI00333F2808